MFELDEFELDRIDCVLPHFSQVYQFAFFSVRSIVRVGLQEAFQFAKSDFIQRSRQRMERVKNARHIVKKNKDVRNLKEGNIDDAILKSRFMPRKAVGKWLNSSSLTGNFCNYRMQWAVTFFVWTTFEPVINFICVKNRKFCGWNCLVPNLQCFVVFLMGNL